ncbi:MAG: hypothetical protein H8E47_10670 [Anaerolineales bacterium]|nr:hypothetical protein [Anaerolineales bacterium]
MLNRWGKQLRANSYVVACVLMGVIGALLLIGWASALQAPGVEIGPDHTQQAYVGDTILYNHTLTNTGATTDTFTLEVLSTRDWPVELVGATQPTGTLSLQVAAQITAPFQISLTVPSGAAGLTDTTIVTATSQLSPTVQDSATDTTIVVYHRIIFPFVAKRWPPVPYQAALNPIDNTDGDGYYTVSWLPAGLADTHVLEEDDNASFSSPTIVYSGAGTSWSVPAPGRLSGTYYYRVRGQNQWGYGVYSNVEAVTVPRFLIADTNLAAGQCTTLSWSFTGIKKLHIIFGYGYDKEPVPGQGSRQVCPSVTTTYKAIVTKHDDSQETHQVTVNVSGTGCGDPIVWYFAPTTYQVHAGQPFSIFWHVECAKGVWLIIGSGSEQGVVGHGSKTDVVIYSTTTFKLKIKKTSGDFVYASFQVKVI